MEAEMESYLDSKGINLIIRSMVAQVCINRPENPVDFMINFLKNNYQSKYELSSSSSADSGVESSTHHSVEIDTDNDLVQKTSAKRPRNSGNRRGAFSSETMNDVNFEETVNSAPKSETAKQRLSEALHKNILFSHLDDDEKEDIFDAMTEAEYAKGTLIIRQGESGDHFYVVDSGECDIFVSSNGIRKHVQHVGPGGSFGELALIYGTLRAADVLATTNVKCWVIDRIAYRKSLMGTTLRKREQYKNWLSKVPILESLTEYERLVVADALESANFNEGDVVVKQGDAGDVFYIIMEGEARVSKVEEGSTEEQQVGYLKASDYFGEIALLMNRPRAATVTAVTPLKCVKLDRERFNRVLGPCDVILRRNLENYNKYMQLE